MLEPVRSLTTLFDQPVPLPPAAFHLLIMGPDLFLAQALPKSGSLSIGRADNADIRITDPLASRLHARLHVTAGMFEIEDIGSINRTKVRDVALEHSERVAGPRPGDRRLPAGRRRASSAHGHHTPVDPLYRHVNSRST